MQRTDSYEIRAFVGKRKTIPSQRELFIALPVMQQLTALLSYLPETSKIFLTCSVIVLLLSLVFLFRFPNNRWNYLGLFAAVALAGFGFAYIDPFLHPWDEQFHALVAKNMLDHPFHPTLMEGSRTDFDYTMWIDNNTWLHKQPLFLWQIALSLKLFGSNLIALRLPSILMHAATACLIFSMGKRYVNHFFAVLAAVLYGFSGFVLDFVSGVQGMDHNDIAFTFYVTASFWSWLKYTETRQLKWAVITGLFAGGAVLCKWLVGLIVFAGWGLVLLVIDRSRKEWKAFFYALVTTIVVVAPWQLYCLAVFPVEYKHEMAYNSLHYFHSVEQHGGPWSFYFEGMKKLYGAGEVLRFFVLIGLLIAFIKGFRKRNPAFLFAASIFLGIYLFFMGAATKLEGYVLIVAPLGFILFVLPFQELFAWIGQKTRSRLPWLVLPILLTAILFVHMNPKGVIDRHNFKTPETVQAWRNDLTKGEREIHSLRGPYRYILVKNASGAVAPALRFMTGKEIYMWKPSLEQEGVVVIDLQN